MAGFGLVAAEALLPPFSPLLRALGRLVDGGETVLLSEITSGFDEGAFILDDAVVASVFLVMLVSCFGAVAAGADASTFRFFR